MKKTCSYRLCGSLESKFKCSVCKILYCSRKCQKICWKEHKKYCRSSYLERMIATIHHTSFIGDYEDLASNLIGVNENLTPISWESIFRFTDKYTLNKNYCVFCQLVVHPMLIASWPSKHFGDLIPCYYSICVYCKNKKFHNTCALPHDNTTECPLVKRFIYLLLSFPLLRELPLEILVKIYKRIRLDFIDYLINNF